MTVSEILANEELRQHEFPVAKDKVFLAHAGVCPLPRRVSAAIRNYAALCGQGDQETLLPSMVVMETRILAARLLGCKAEEIALVGPTSLALSFIAGGFPFRRGDNILIYFDDYPANVYPWMNLAERGVEVRFINIRELGQIRPVDVLGQVDEQTRLVALASCHFVAGYRIALDTIGKGLRERGVRFCVDGIQTLGALPTCVEQVDFLAADAHKWLLGPCAAGLLYVRQSVQEQLRPTALGWHNVRCPNYIAQEEMILRRDAQRYEAGTHNLLGVVGLHAALGLLLELGIESISDELLRKRNWLVPALESKGYSVLQAKFPPANTSGIVTFSKPGVDLAALHAKLETAGIITSLRAVRSGQKYLRLSPHFYNTDQELHRTLELL